MQQKIQHLCVFFFFFSSLPPTKSCMCTQLLPSSCKPLFSRVSGNSRQTLLSLQHCGCQSGLSPTHLLPACLPKGREPSVACCQDCWRSDGWVKGWMDGWMDGCVRRLLHLHITSGIHMVTAAKEASCALLNILV